jgi:hypothetical protein
MGADQQDLGRRQVPAWGQDLGYLPHDAVPEFLGSEPVELVLDLGEAVRTRAASSQAALPWEAGAVFPA